MQNRIISHKDEEKIIDIITEFTKKKIEESGSKGIVIGLSGGLDSTVTAYLCTKALGKDKILGLILPSGINNPKDIEDAVKVAEELEIKYEILDINESVESFQKMCHKCSKNKLANGNLMSRIRMLLLYYYSNTLEYLVVGTGNRTELFVGYFSKYGDGGVDFLPIGDLYKTEVYKIAEYLRIPRSIIEKSPSAGLWENQTDEKELGISYDLLDQILYHMLDEKLSTEEIIIRLNIGKEEVLKVKDMVALAEHKLYPPPIANLK